jgi:hypothetical protein
MEGKRQYNLDAVLVPLVGARYEVHGLRAHVAPLLMNVDPDSSRERLEETAERHASLVSGFSSLAYDSPGYGDGAKKSDGTPRLLEHIGSLAKEFDVPYIADNAWGTPFAGTDPTKIDADVMVYSMDKAAGAPTSGLVIGQEEAMVSIRKAVGMQGERHGVPSSYGKASYVIADPGKEAIAGQLAALRYLRDHPADIRNTVDLMHDIVSDAFESVDFGELRDGIEISNSYNSGAVEVNYQNTWNEERFGIPIFTIEDFYAGSEPIMGSLKQMGIVPTISYDANIFISPGLGTTDESGQIIPERMRWVAKGAASALQIVAKHAGVLEEVAVPASGV